MSYIDDNLMNGESVLYRAKLHWVIFLWPVIFLIIALFFFSEGGGATGVGIFFLVLTLLSGAGAFISYTTSEFGVTNKRVLVKVGLIRRNSLEVLLTKVEGVQVQQGILGRILGFGSVVVSGTGGAKDPFHKISTPLALRKKVQEQIPG